MVNKSVKKKSAKVLNKVTSEGVDEMRQQYRDKIRAAAAKSKTPALEEGAFMLDPEFKKSVSALTDSGFHKKSKTTNSSDLKQKASNSILQSRAKGKKLMTLKQALENDNW